ncbi:class I adenylate-forming enzyme family protein [Bradyrhizobium sp. URHD0069]|uniref:class I adenylate-forming enzyme family protein n=1 Tax=Bradyrhizobium sp. URHD0069 TaxID=1380355 RepID=UPI002110E354|nr:fatty acid--CoA ligase family protein [Bradyrhizobium sp. URHD0069]
MTFLSCAQTGALFVLLERFDADTVLDTIERHRCSLHVGFPAQYAALLDSYRSRSRNLGALRLCLTGGDACPIDLQEQVTSAFDAPLYNYWAATEVFGTLTFGPRPGQVTRITKDAQVRLVDENGDDVRDGEIGELLVRGPNLFAGYWNDPQSTAESMKWGWYHTGDLMQRGAADELIFVARKKDIIIRGGTNISPVEVEQAIVAAHPLVEEAAVVGIPDAVLGQRVVGFVKLAKGAGKKVISEVIDNLATRLAAYKVPERLMELDAMPRNALSKIDRKALQAMATNADRVHRSLAASSVSQAQRSDDRRSRRAAPGR